MEMAEPHMDHNLKKTNAVFIALCFSALILLLITYSNHFHNAFHFDDDHTIVNNAYIRHLKNIPLFFASARTQSSLPANQTYRPLTSATFAIDYWLGNGLKTTFYFHLSTFIWYVVQCILLYFLYDTIISTAGDHHWNRYIALFAVIWYGLHPANAETINYIYQRADMLSTCMVVAGFVLYACLPRWRRWYLYLIPVAVGMFCKEPTAMFAPLLFFYIMFFEKNASLKDGFRPGRLADILKASAPAFLLCGILGAFVVRMMSATWTPGGTSRYAYLITQPFVMLRYFTTFFLPTDLSADSDWKVVSSILDIRVAAGVVFIAVMLYIAWAVSRKPEGRPTAFGILWFFIALAPTSSVIPLAEVTNDHRMFFPFVGLMLAICNALGQYIIRNEAALKRSIVYRTALILLAAGILAGSAWGTYQRNIVWHTEESLWRDVTLKSPGNGRGLMNYGLTQMEKGNFREASVYFQKALKLLPEYAYLDVNLGVLKSVTNEPAEAERYFKAALRLDPHNPETFYYYARWLAGQERDQEAIALLRQALRISPGHSSSESLLKDILARGHNLKPPLKPEEASEPSRQMALAEDYLRLSLALYNEGRYQDSIRASRQALKVKPDYALAYNNICAACNALGQWEKAVAACEKGIHIAPDMPILKNNLALAKRGLNLKRSALK
jgi:tetratricopeptide (TPR) repeat protein